MTEALITLTGRSVQFLEQYRGDWDTWMLMRDGAIDAPDYLPKGGFRSLQRGDGTFAQIWEMPREQPWL